MENRKDEVIIKALELFGQYGIKSVSMDDIAKSLAISKKTLYNIVKDKDTLVLGVIEYLQENFKSLLSIFHDKTYGAIEQFFEFERNVIDIVGNLRPTFIYDLKKYHPSLNKNAIDDKNKMLKLAFHANIEQGKSEGVYHDDIDDMVVVNILLLFHIHLLDLIVEDELSGDGLSSEAIRREAFKYHFRAVCTEKGYEELKIQLSKLDLCEE